MLANFIIAFISIRFLRRQFSLKKELPFWDDLLLKALYASIGITVLSMFLPEKLEYIGGALWFFIFSLIVYVLWLLRHDTLGKMLAYAVIPFFVISTVYNILNFFFLSFFESNSTTLDILNYGSMLWMLAYGIGAWRHYKTLRAEKEKNESITKHNDELEELVVQRTAEISQQKEELIIALDELKATQAQLIQSEKLASLGELTAGIAHEIQNPLNFVNNFSELTKELAGELEAEAEKAVEDRDIDLQKELLLDIMKNLSKISHHGNRASSIVKSMLEHSRMSSGTKECVELNKICDEYLRLSYHGLRAKDKSFNSDFKTELDPNVGSIEVVPQDFGRVLLNVLNNAFHAVKSKSKNGIEDYKPLVTVSTKLLKNKVQVSIKDNGIGISTENKLKIFQPFFTTKPSGEGTGLGLSLSHDIVIAHGGEIKLKSKPGLGSEFILTLPRKLKIIT